MEYQLRQSFPYKFHRVIKLLQVRLELNLKRIGLNLNRSHWMVLNILWEEGGLSQTEISNTLNQYKTLITRTIDHLIEMNLAERRNCPDDRRKHRIYLTAKGLELKNPMREIAMQGMLQAMGETADHEWELFLRILDRMEKNLEHTA